VAQWTTHPPHEQKTRVLVPPGCKIFRYDMAMLLCTYSWLNMYSLFVCLNEKWRQWPQKYFERVDITMPKLRSELNLNGLKSIKWFFTRERRHHWIGPSGTKKTGPFVLPIGFFAPSDLVQLKQSGLSWVQTFFFWTRFWASDCKA
jgi:hypothetical protein